MDRNKLVNIVEFKIPRGWHEVDHEAAWRERELSPELQAGLAEYEAQGLHTPYSDELNLEPIDENSCETGLKVCLSGHALTPSELEQAKHYFASNHPIKLDDLAEMALFSIYFGEDAGPPDALQHPEEEQAVSAPVDPAPDTRQARERTPEEMAKSAAMLEEYHELKAEAQKLQAMADAMGPAAPWQVFLLGAKVDSVGSMRAAIIGRRQEHGGDEPESFRTLACFIPAFHAVETIEYSAVVPKQLAIDMVEVYFFCPSEEWDDHFPVVDALLQSLKWKNAGKP